MSLTYNWYLTERNSKSSLIWMRRFETHISTAEVTEPAPCVPEGKDAEVFFGPQGLGFKNLAGNVIFLMQRYGEQTFFQKSGHFQPG